MNSNNDILTIIAGLAGTAGGLFFLFLFILSVLMPLIIYLIHRSTKRTAEATEQIARQNKILIDQINTSSDFSFGAPKPPITRRAQTTANEVPESQAYIVKSIVDGKDSNNLIGLCSCGKRFLKTV